MTSSGRRTGSASTARKKIEPRSDGEAPIEDDRTSVSTEALHRAILDNLHYVQGKIPEIATRNDWYAAVAYTVRDRILRRWLCTVATLIKEDVRAVAYLSAEFLLGPHLGNNLINLGIQDQIREAVTSLGFDLEDLIAEEQEPGLGNGGLGRLAACFLDSLATLEIPAVGYGIRYEFGIFDQVLRDGWQVETTDKWLRLGNPWEIRRPELTYRVNLGGRTETYRDAEGRFRIRWIPHKVVKGVAYDTPILGYRVNTANLLRLWSAEATESFDFQTFNVGDYYGAVHDKVDSENISKVLYPNDEATRGKQLRLAQQYFFVSCALQDMLRMHLGLGRGQPETFHERFAVQLNDTHPSIGVAELMRLLVDEHMIDWEAAWKVTRKTFSYTNHTLLPEALEKWSLPLFAGLLPRHLEIIYEINRRFLDEVRAERPGDDQLVARVSLIDEAGEKHIRMANLATVGSHAVNGVAALHTDLLKRDVLHDFAMLHPDRFLNVTNGVTPRRWMVLSNPKLAGAISRRIGEKWVVETEKELRGLESLAGDSAFQEEWRGIKQENKRALAAIIKDRTGIAADPETLFDVQVKRIHEYKRQQLNILHVVTLYDRLRRDPKLDITPRTVVFGGKAAPGYFMAKLIIKLINSVAEVVNGDPAVGGRLKVVFLPDFNVKNGQHVYPAADLSEQISTAGKEASGTGNMKFAMNGALTIGTLDGANVEMREAVGAENFFLFGLKADEVQALRSRGYNARERYESSAGLKEAIDIIASGHFSRGDAGLFRPLVDSLLGHDDYMVLADYPSYIECQDRAAAAYRDREKWTRMSILNVARMGRFSSDRSIQEYAERIWNVCPVEVELDGG